jgi:DNA-nicking Smr family endonuclease
VEEKSFVNKQIKDVGQNLKIAIQNASKDIFERVNSKEKNFIQIDGKTIFSVDLHGLHSKEARSIVDEHVLPVLDALGQIMIITGRGIHSKKRGKSILKENVKKYFVELKIRVQDITGNDGAFFIFKNGA